MKAIPRIEITPAMLVSTTVAEPAPGETVWVSGGTYGVGDLRILTSTHRVYECTVAVAGSAVSPDVDALHWRDAGPTLRWAMFDLERSSQTSYSGGNLVVKIAPGRRIDSIGLVGLQGASVQLQMHVGTTELYSRVINLLLRNTTSWRQYFFGTFKVLESIVRFDLPLSAGATITITIAPTGGVAKCGGVVIGMAEELGTIVDSPVSDVDNFSKVTRDEFGVATLVKRRNVPRLQYRVRAPVGWLNRLRQLRDDLDAVPTLFSGADDRETSPFFETLLVLGIPKKWSIALRATSVESDLQIEEI